MFTSLQTYLIAALFIVLPTISVVFSIDHTSAQAELATLHANAAKYEVAIEEQDKTINQLQDDANRLQDANTAYSDAVQKSEANFVVEWQTIDAIDFTAPKSKDDLERQINDGFANSVANLRAETTVISQA